VALAVASGRGGPGGHVTNESARHGPGVSVTPPPLLPSLARCRRVANDLYFKYFLVIAERCIKPPSSFPIPPKSQSIRPCSLHSPKPQGITGGGDPWKLPPSARLSSDGPPGFACARARYLAPIPLTISPLPPSLLYAISELSVCGSARSSQSVDLAATVVGFTRSVAIPLRGA
jgi:hypothetical protein